MPTEATFVRTGREEYDRLCQALVDSGTFTKLDDAKRLAEFEKKAHDNLALDHGRKLVYIAPTRVNLNLTEERWPDISFRETRDY